MIILFVVIAFLFILISFTLVQFFLALEEGEKEPTTALWIAVGFGIVSTVLIHFAMALLNLSPSLLFTTQTGLFVKFLIVFSAASIEEILKFVPLALFIYKKNYFLEHTDGIIYFAIAGLTFGVLEKIAYMLLEQDMSTGILMGYFNLLQFPIFHGATMGIVGYFFAKQKKGKSSIKGTIFALASISLLHAFSNYSLLLGGEIISLVIPITIHFGVIILLFILFNKAKKNDFQDGLSTDQTEKYNISNSKKAVASFIISVLGILLSLISFTGMFLGIVGLIFGYTSLKSNKKGFAIAGITISTVAIIISLYWWIDSNIDVESIISLLNH